MPAGTPIRLNSPSPVVVVLRIGRIPPGSINCTLAAGTAAPDGSTADPLSRPVTCDFSTATEAARYAAAARATALRVRIAPLLSSPRAGFDADRDTPAGWKADSQ